jgi:hypothetical protein
MFLNSRLRRPETACGRRGALLRMASQASRSCRGTGRQVIPRRYNGLQVRRQRQSFGAIHVALTATAPSAGESHGIEIVHRSLMTVDSVVGGPVLAIVDLMDQGPEVSSGRWDFRSICEFLV